MKKYKHTSSQSWFLTRITGIARRLLPILKKGAGLFLNRQARSPLYPDAAGQRSRRKKKIVIRFALLSLVGIAASVTVFLAFQLLGYSDIFRINTVTIQGNMMTRDHQIYEISGLKNNASMLQIDPQQIAKNIAREPWINKVKIKRDWPSTLIISIVEHKPLAMVNAEKNGQLRLIYVDSTGSLFAPVMTARDIDFPVITGSPEYLKMDGHEIQKKTPAKQALQFLRLARKSEVLPVQAISEIHIDNDENLVLYLVEHPFPIFLGKDEMREKFFRLIKIVQDLYRRKEFNAVAEIRMEYAKNKVLVAKTDS